MKIRKGTFETNSSSTHSIAISKDKVNPYNLPVGYSIYFRIGEYGWEEDEYSFPDYMYTALLCADDQKSITKLKSILNKWGIGYKFQKPEWRYYHYDNQSYRYLDNGGIDHSGEAYSIMIEILNDEDLLARALFGDSCVYTGNDNDSEGYNMCWCAEETIWDHDKHDEVKNPNHNPEKYDYFFKGN